MSEMVERVARAMARHRWDEFDEEHREAGRELARNAIAAMREPTKSIANVNTMSIAYGSDEIWRAMIDEALK